MNGTDRDTAANVVKLRPPLTLALAGNPNCGKSALFNALTGIRQTTGNWPGVTVERKEGSLELDGRRVRVIDLPGIYSLDASSLDEMVTRDYLLGREADLIVNVLDAGNLERHLYLTVQLLEMGVPVLIALNMMDIARKRGIRIDTEALAEALGCPVVPLVAVSKEGLTELQARLLAVAEGREPAGMALTHGECVEAAVLELLPRLEGAGDGDTDAGHANARWLALKLLESDPIAEHAVGLETLKLAESLRQQIAERTGEDADLHIADTRFGHAHALARRVVREERRVERTVSDRIDQVVLSRVFGIPLFLLMIYLMFMFTMNIGGAFIDFFDQVGQALFVDGLGELLGRVGAPDWLTLVLATGIGGGLQVVGTFIPVIASLYIVLSILEDSGYMARAAFVMDRFMRSIGLPGKAFVPLIVGFGCNVPAVMATRTLESERERKLTILMNPFMSCGARLPVYALFAAAFFPHSGQNLVFVLYLTGIAVAILSGLAMKHTLLKGDSSGLLMELPPYHLPTVKGVMLRTWDRVKLFLREAGKIIVLMVLALNLLATIGSDWSLGNQDSEHSILAEVSRTATPLFAPMGIREDNWPAVLGIFSGVLAKEVIVGTLDSLYGRLAAESHPIEEPEPFDLWSALGAAASSIGDNLGHLGERLLDPLGLDIGEASDRETAAVEQGVQTGTFGAMAERFDGQAGAFAYLLFVLLYFPCVATIGAIVRESGAAWATFVGFWTTGIAFLTATVFYQTATFERDPLTAGLWIGGGLGLFAAVLIGLRLWAARAP
ncbi:Fe(2+) transporter permease subunit FeoB [Allochromatium humboldtianum]|uniref:Ferrous iron transport protein B n=1 Tax=Allochromatium humboldtianum TaxID=504901 RepID=A0A850R7T4_9GAMM|nr:Fe(2+) transporter permease subunit FeoB [Allochromatium humboldtianum]NVZ09398.1 Fe(2+) transporter permease subunit FeoB [Allochromatium humboldtianum]